MFHKFNIIHHFIIIIPLTSQIQDLNSIRQKYILLHFKRKNFIIFAVIPVFLFFSYFFSLWRIMFSKVKCIILQINMFLFLTIKLFYSELDFQMHRSFQYARQVHRKQLTQFSIFQYAILLFIVVCLLKQVLLSILFLNSKSISYPCCLLYKYIA